MALSNRLIGAATTISQPDSLSVVLKKPCGTNHVAMAQQHHAKQQYQGMWNFKT